MKPTEKQEKPENYIKLKLLGTGTFGKAFLVKGEHSGELFVIKEIDISEMSDAEKKEALKEAKIMESLNHPNIIRFKEVYKTKKGALCIVMDYADGGDLLQKMKDAKGNYFPESQILDWFTQLALAIKHCHDRKILHRDLKAQNIFLTVQDYVKLGDFGIAKVFQKTQDKAMTLVGTPYYLSPEIILSKPYNFEADIWALGVLLYEMCSFRPPFDSNSLTGLAEKIISGKYLPIPSQYSENMRKLISRMLEVDPNKRATIHEILNMEFIHERIKGFISQTLYNMEFAHTIIHGKNLEQIKAMEKPLLNFMKLNKEDSKEITQNSKNENNLSPTEKSISPIEKNLIQNDKSTMSSEKTPTSSEKSPFSNEKTPISTSKTPNSSEKIQSGSQNSPTSAKRSQFSSENSISPTDKSTSPTDKSAIQNTEIDVNKKERKKSVELSQENCSENRNLVSPLENPRIIIKTRTPSPGSHRQNYKTSNKSARQNPIKTPAVSNSEKPATKPLIMQNFVQPKSNQEKISNFMSPQKIKYQRPVSNTPTKNPEIHMKHTPHKVIGVPNIKKPPINPTNFENNRSQYKMSRNIIRCDLTDKKRGNSMSGEDHKLGVQKMNSFDNNNKSGNQISERKVVKLRKPKSIKIDLKGEEINKRVTELCQNIIEISRVKETKIKKCDYDIMNMMEEMESILENKPYENRIVQYNSNVQENVRNPNTEPFANEIESCKYTFKTIEGIAYYLQNEYGFEKFKKIYEKASFIDRKNKGQINVRDYEDKLKGLLTRIEIEKSLALFLCLCRLKYSKVK